MQQKYSDIKGKVDAEKKKKKSCFSILVYIVLK